MKLVSRKVPLLQLWVFKCYRVEPLTNHCQAADNFDASKTVYKEAVSQYFSAGNTPLSKERNVTEMRRPV